jgi:hypothetical protein
MKNSTRTGEPEGVAVHTTEEPLTTAPLAIFVEILLPEGGVGRFPVEEFTVKVKLVVLVTPPPVPATVIVSVPAGVDAAVAIVSRLEQVGLQVFCEKEALAPEGNPDAERETGSGDPETRLAVMVLIAVDPWVADRLIEFASEKLKGPLLPWS